ncbi:MAG TPA: winged helix-turn-helix domain-containing protein [Candidatus Thermoplasmatota archaeon]|nr:winged helix-turn-helix domain-containing protein [Candidatus Thermoplasmatota archaeon]
MKTLIDEFGWNAGKVWKILNTKGPLKEEALLHTTKLKEDELWTAIGWLAREGKICRENNMYKLGQTNLTPKIGADAGKVWSTVAKQGEIDISMIAKTIQITEVDAYQALGWLARENKVSCKKVKAKVPKIKVTLK